MWEYGISCGYDTNHFDNEQQAKWFYLMTKGQGLNPFAFKRNKNTLIKCDWKTNEILNSKTAPFKLEYGFKPECFYIEKEAIKKYNALKEQGISVNFLLNINGIDFVKHEPEKVYTTLPKGED